MDEEKGIGGGCLLQSADGGGFELAGGGNGTPGLAFSTRGAKAERDSAVAFGARGDVNRVHLAGVVAALPAAATVKRAACVAFSGCEQLSWDSSPGRPVCTARW